MDRGVDMPNEDIEQTLERGVVKEEVEQLIKQETSTKLAAVFIMIFKLTSLT